jgi:hypothetical protein
VGPRGFIFSRIVQTDSNLEIENGSFTLFQKLGHFEQFSQLCQWPMLNRIRVKNPRTDSTFGSLMNFKRDLNLLEKYDKFSKIPS